MGTTCLTVCPECSRHLRCEERACPFCGARNSSGSRILEYRIKTRLSRSHAFSLGASLTLAGFVSSCEQGGNSVYGAPCNPPSCTFPTNGGNAGAAAHGGNPTGGTSGAAGTGGIAGGGTAGSAGSAAGTASGGAGGDAASGAGGSAAGAGGSAAGSGGDAAGAGGDAAGGAAGAGGDLAGGAGGAG